MTLSADTKTVKRDGGEVAGRLLEEEAIVPGRT